MRNWTVKEAAAVIAAGTDKESIKEIGKHFPMFAMIIAKGDLYAAMEAMPDSITMRKIENNLTAGTSVEDESEDGEEEEEVAVADESNDLGSMSTKELMKLCDKRGIKVPHYGKNKQFYLEALNGAGDAEEAEEEKPAKSKAKPAKAAKAEEEVEEEVEEDPVALYKQCKRAGLDVKPRQAAKYYKDALSKSEEAEDEDDWGDEEEEVEEKPVKKDAKPVKKAEKSVAKKTEKSAKKAEPEPDEEEEDEESDDDWDI